MKKLISILLVMIIIISLIPVNAFASDNNLTEDVYSSYTDENGTYHESFIIFDDYGNMRGWGWGESTTPGNTTGNSDSYANSSSDGSYDSYGSSDYGGSSGISADDMARLIITRCKNYDNLTSSSGVRNQITWMDALLNTANSAYLSDLSFGDALLISLLNHEDILSEKLKNPSSKADINKIVAEQICENAEGYADIESIAKATGLSVEKARNILNGIAKGTITEETIKRGKTTSAHTNRGPYLRARAMEHEQVYNYLISEVERMTGDEASLAVLYDDFGGGYIQDLLSGKPLDSYQIQLYKEHLAKVLDEEGFSTISDYYLADSDKIKLTKKVSSIISDICEYEFDALGSKLPEEQKNFLKKSLENGVLSEAEAREYLILTGEFKPGEHGIGDATKTLIGGYKQLQGIEKALDASGKVFSTLDKIKKTNEFIEYWTDDYARQELILDNMVEALSERGGDPELMAAAKQLKSEYESKIYGTLKMAYDELIDNGIGSVKATVPLLGITEACISLGGELTGASDKVDAIETCLAMQGICYDAIASYEEAVIAINNGDESGEAVNHVLTTFSIARISLQHYYEALIELADSEEEKTIYSVELAKLKSSELGKASISSIRGGGGGGSR